MNTFAELNHIVDKFVISLDRRSSYSLDRVEKILTQLGSPQENFKTIHIAGTSGKTSTAYYAAAMLEAAGYKVGLSVSPYVEQVNERVQIGTQPLAESVFCKEFEQFFKIVNTLSIVPTYFELFVTFAYWYFAKTGVEYAVIEVGLGGLLDGTNVIKRPDKICLITDIGLDHTLILGKTIKKIAAQKAGIIQEHNHVLMYRQDEVINHEVEDRARKKHAILHYVEPLEVKADIPDFQKRNWLLAKNACELAVELDGRSGLNDKQWLETTKVHIPGRLESIQYKDKVIVLDGAHNSQKVRSLAASFRTKFPKKAPAVLLAIGDNKTLHLHEITEELNKLSSFTIITTFKKGRGTERVSVDPEQIAKGFDDNSYLINQDLAEALDILLNREEPVLLITGSLYLVGAVKKILKELS